MGILDSLFGPASANPRPGLLDPRAAKMQYLSSALMGMGGGLLSGNNWGQGLGQGILGANQLAQQATADMYRKAEWQQKQAEYQKGLEEKQAQQAALEKLYSTLPQDQQALAGAFPEAFSKSKIDNIFSAPKAPTTDERNLPGGLAIKTVWNAQTGKYEDSGDPYERWKPGPDTLIEAPKTLEERDRQMILQGDPASPGYAMAYGNLFLTPKFVQTETGTMPIMPEVPLNVRPPTYPGQSSGDATGAPGVGSTAAPVIPGTQPALTDFQGASGGYAGRMAAAEPIIEKFGGELGSLTASVLERVPFGNYGQSAKYQQGRQAQEDWVRAKLRKESGAVIADTEMDREIATYFARPGDGPEVIKQKTAARRTALEAMKKQAGPNYFETGKGVEWKIVNGQLVPVN